MDEAQRGSKALAASDFPAAIQHFTRALSINPHATDYYIKRSMSYCRLGASDGGPDGKAALRDAEMAVSLGAIRARRELILAGQMRRAIALYHLGKIGDAGFLFKLVRDKVGKREEMTTESAMEKKAKNQDLDIWELKVKSRLAKLDPGDEKAIVTVKEMPDVSVPPEEELKKLFLSQLQDIKAGASTSENKTGMDAKVPSAADPATRKESAKELDNTSSADIKVVSAPAPLHPPVASMVRHEWYQTHDTVVITLYAKGVPKDRADIEIQDRSLSVTFPLASGSDFSFNLDTLFGPVNVATSTFSIMSTKVEILLRKQQPGQKWSGLEGDLLPSNTTEETGAASLAQSPSAQTQGATQSQPSIANFKVPAYPTSSRTGTKDWDKLASTLTKKKKKRSNTQGKGKETEIGADNNKSDEGDKEMEEEGSDYSDIGGDPVDAFFKKLYSNADPDTRRAMVKSYYESEGTALSTNWAEVGKGKMEVRPPSDD